MEDAVGQILEDGWKVYKASKKYKIPVITQGRLLI
jgi:hypothetical protein